MKVYRVEVVLYEIEDVGPNNAEQFELLEEEVTHEDFTTYEEAMVEFRSHMKKETR